MLTYDSSIKAAHHGSTRKESAIKFLVFHFTGNGGTTATAKANANYFANTDRPASAHYVCDEGNIVYNTLNPLIVGYSVGDVGKGTLKNKVNNTNSVSIEMVSHSKYSSPKLGCDMYYISEETIKHALEVGVMLMKKFNIPITRVVRHYDVTNKKCPDPMCYTQKGELAWANFKNRLQRAYETGIYEEDDEVITDINVNIMGKDTTTKGIFKNNSNYLSAQVFKTMGLEVTSEGSKPVIKPGSVLVSTENGDTKISGFNANGTNYVALREIMELLGKEVTWKDGKVVLK